MKNVTILQYMYLRMTIEELQVKTEYNKFLSNWDICHWCCWKIKKLASKRKYVMLLITIMIKYGLMLSWPNFFLPKLYLLHFEIKCSIVFWNFNFCQSWSYTNTHTHTHTHAHTHKSTLNVLIIWVIHTVVVRTLISLLLVMNNEGSKQWPAHSNIEFPIYYKPDSHKQFTDKT